MRSISRRPRRPPQSRQGGALVGRSDAWRRVIAEVELHAGHDRPVLLSGERGVGKLRCAAAIHDGGDRRSEPFTVLDASLSAVDVERQWIAPLQAALDRPSGTLALRHLDALRDRALVATTALIDQRHPTSHPRLIGTVTGGGRAGGEFGALLDRFDVTIALPALRTRPQDVIDLFEAFARELRDEAHPSSTSPEVLRELMRYRWPGNARELRHVVRTILLVRPTGQLTVGDLPAEVRTDVAPPGLSRLAALEREAIVDALRDSGGNKQAAADRLGVSRSTLYRKLTAYSI